ncbi:MAG: hypothetical protein HY366_03405 [Candidatus Aenigmarchaeota archaeon]|nr:hypothetical protein [Candidatus Aenigmarchaeota archaeon]
MQSPLCEICLKNEDILCAGCQRKLTAGMITHTEVELSRILWKLQERYKSIQAGGFAYAKDVGKTLLVVVPKGSAGKMIGKGGAIISELESALHKKVKIVEEGTLEDVVKDIIGRSELIGINKVFGAEGERYRVRVRRAQLNKSEVEGIIRAVTGKKAEVVFE